VNPELVRPAEGPPLTPYYVDSSQHTDGAISGKLLLYAIFKRKWQILAILTVVVLSILVSGLVRPNVYKSNAKVMIRPGRAEIQVSAGDQRELTVPISATTEMINSEMEILQSQELMRQVIERMEQAGTPIFGADTTMPMAEQVSVLRGMVAVAPAPQSNVISIDLFARDPEKGQVILGALVGAYLERHAALHGSTGATAFFEEQKTLLRGRVIESEAKLAAFVSREGLVLPEDQIRTVLKDAMRGKDSFVVQMAKIRGLERRVATLREQIASEPETIQRDVERVNPTGQGLGFEVVKKESERANLLQGYTADDRLVKDLEGEIATLKQKIRETAGNYIVGTERITVNPIRQDLERRLLNSQMNLDDLRARADGLQERITNQSEQSSRLAVEMRQKSIELSGLEQEVAGARESYMLYEKKQEEARIAEALDKERFLNVSVLDGASMPTRPFNRMNPLMLVAALVIGSGLGVGTAVGLELLGRNFKFEEQVEQYLELPVFAVIPDMSEVAETQHQV
jgi:uncharacterized protein involved in exopolysaccharide biosynthesis